MSLHYLRLAKNRVCVGVLVLLFLGGCASHKALEGIKTIGVVSLSFDRRLGQYNETGRRYYIDKRYQEKFLSGEDAYFDILVKKLEKVFSEQKEAAQSTRFMFLKQAEGSGLYDKEKSPIPAYIYVPEPYLWAPNGGLPPKDLVLELCDNKGWDAVAVLSFRLYKKEKYHSRWPEHYQYQVQNPEQQWKMWVSSRLPTTLELVVTINIADREGRLLMSESFSESVDSEHFMARYKDVSDFDMSDSEWHLQLLNRLVEKLTNSIF